MWIYPIKTSARSIQIICPCPTVKDAHHSLSLMVLTSAKSTPKPYNIFKTFESSTTGTLY